MRPEYFVPLIMALTAVLIECFILWVKATPGTPDPWDQKDEDAVHQPDAVPLCPHCLSPHDEDCRFCPECGSATGLYNNLNPYLYIFSLGELMRLGVSGQIRRNVTTVVGYLLLSLSEYLIFAPLYWFLLFRNLIRLRREKAPDAGML
jgi:hypothetical protein